MTRVKYGGLSSQYCYSRSNSSVSKIVSFLICESKNQGAQEGKGKGWVKGAYLEGAAPAQSTWQKDGEPGRDREQGKEHPRK